MAHRTNCIGSTGFVGAEVCHKRLLREAFFKWISFVFWLTPAVIASNGVDTDRVLAANIA